MNPWMVLKVVGDYRVPVWGSLLYSPCMFILSEPFKLTHLMASAGSVSSGTQQGTGGPFCSSVRSNGLPRMPAMASMGPEGIGATCNVGSPSFGDAGIVGVGEWWAVFGACPIVVGACCLPILGDEVPEGGGVKSLFNSAAFFSFCSTYK